MKTLMRNGRDRRSENPSLGHAKKERVSLFGTDQRITSGPAARRPHSKAEYMTAPERFADSQIPLAPRAPSIHDPKATLHPFQPDGRTENKHGLYPAGVSSCRVSEAVPERKLPSYPFGRTSSHSAVGRRATQRLTSFFGLSLQAIASETIAPPRAI
jgi:hypothetical protein